jgi:8-oxo-dGTP pyrophosphatase MutT (NUDIX family)
MIFLALSNRIRMAHATESVKELASVAVICNGQLLMGLRRDNRKWTLPGGHLNAGERPYDGAIRELWEEAGIRAGCLSLLGSERVTTFSGHALVVHAFTLYSGKRPTSLANDPDKEVIEWRWVPMDLDCDELKEENLHSPRNVVLKHLGLQNW